jgi:hypothetical protein
VTPILITTSFSTGGGGGWNATSSLTLLLSFYWAFPEEVLAGQTLVSSRNGVSKHQAPIGRLRVIQAPSGPETQKHYHKLTFGLKNSLKQHFFNKI